MSERTITEDQIREEHLREVPVRVHWSYLFGVIGGGIVLMLAFIAALGGAQ